MTHLRSLSNIRVYELYHGLKRSRNHIIIMAIILKIRQPPYEFQFFYLGSILISSALISYSVKWDYLFYTVDLRLTQ